MGKGADDTTAGTAWYKSDSGGALDRNLIDATKTALKLGYYHLDGAEVYNTEAEVGIAIKESKVPREKLFVTTKVITNIKDIPNAIDTSLKKLQLDYVDLSVPHLSHLAGSRCFGYPLASRREIMSASCNVSVADRCLAI